MNELILTYDEWLEAAKASETYHYPNPPLRTIGPFGSGATLKTDGEKIVGRVEAPAFRIGGVYRNRRGQVVRLTNECTGTHLAKWQRELPGHSFAQMRDAASLDPAGYCSLIDGRYVADHQVDDSPSHLLPGELVQRDGQWVAMEEAKPEITVQGYDISLGLGSFASQEVAQTVADAMNALMHAAAAAEAMANASMQVRDIRQPTARERQVMARINLAKSLAAEWEAAKKQPALAHPYPFARNFQG